MFILVIMAKIKFAQALEVSIVVGLNVEIMGIAPGSDPRWTISSSTTGPEIMLCYLIPR
jgi:hypothetical protein